jgi:hypothetical protein
MAPNGRRCPYEQVYPNAFMSDDLISLVDSLHTWVCPKITAGAMYTATGQIVTYTELNMPDGRKGRVSA